MTPEGIIETKLTQQQLYAALNMLPDKQAYRVYAHYILGISKAELARMEGVQESAIRDSINRALKHLFNYLRNSQ